MRATAWSPGHVSLMFLPESDGSSYVGSTGAGLCIESGVETTVVLAEEEQGSRHEVVRETLRRMDVEAVASHEVEIPLGAGLGGSGALALSTALAAASLARKTFNEAVLAAHEAEVKCSTGLGDVPAQSLGGAVVRLGPGVPPGAELDRLPVPPSGIGHRVLGERSTGESLASVDRMPELEELLEVVSLDGLLREGWRFSRRTELCSEGVVEEVRRIERLGGTAAQAHLGETVVTTLPELEGFEYTRISSAGAHVREVRR